MLSAANQRSLPKVCCLQRICDSLSKLSCLRQNSIRCWNCVGCSKLAFAAEIMLAAANEHSLLKLWRLQLICDSLSKLSCLPRISIHCQKCVFCSEFVIRCHNQVVCSKLAFTVEMVLSSVNQRPLLKVCCLQWICDLLPKSSCLQRIRIRCWSWIVLQGISDHCRKCIDYSEIVIRCRNWVACSELAFAAESVLAVAK